MTKQEVKQQFPALLAGWRHLPENAATDEQGLRLSDFHRWLLANHPEATRFRFRRRPGEDLQQWFDFETNQSWRN